MQKKAKVLRVDRFRKPKWFSQAGNIIFIMQQQRAAISLKPDESNCSQREGENVILSGSKLQLLRACMVNQRSFTVTQSSGGREGADRRQAQQDQTHRIPRAHKRLTAFNQLCRRRKFSALLSLQLLLLERNGRAYKVLQTKGLVSQSAKLLRFRCLTEGTWLKYGDINIVITGQTIW